MNYYFLEGDTMNFNKKKVVRIVTAVIGIVLVLTMVLALLAPAF